MRPRRRCAAVFLLFAASCSFTTPKTQPVLIQPNHERAELYVDGEHIGKGTASVEMTKETAHTVMAKCGDSAGVTQVRRRISTEGIVDLIAGAFFIAPWFGVFAPGFWQLDPPAVAVVVPDTSDCEGPLIPTVEPSPPSS